MVVAMNQDLSNRTVFILVVLTLIISTLSTFTILSNVEAREPVQPLPIGESLSTTGEIRIELISDDRVTSTNLEGLE
jgi:hypothetical protein